VDVGLDLAGFLGTHTPFQAMSRDELAELADGSTVVDFPALAMVADYATRVPDDVWMVRSGQVTLMAADGSVIDTVGPGGLFGYTPLLTDGGMEFTARTTVPSALVRLPDGLVRAQFRQACRTGVPRDVGVESREGRAAHGRTRDRQQTRHRVAAR
jgi:CBS domain-containing protein